MFTEKDIEQIENRGLTAELVLNQLDRFKNGFIPLQISKSATVNDGIIKLGEDEVNNYAKAYDSKEGVDVIKFVPASGAATRMFKPLFQFLEQYDGSNFDSIVREEKKIGKFFTELDEFAFYRDLADSVSMNGTISIDEALELGNYRLVVENILKETGLNYGNLPKGLLKFHAYKDEVRTAVQEHLVEGRLYASKRGKIRIHLTVSPEHKDSFQAHIKNSSNDEIEVSFSTQLSKTDTIASKPNFSPFRLENGDLLFRPAGHGALLENLNEIEADIVFIKNIDNVVPDRLKPETVRYKKALAGILLSYQEKAFSLLNKIDSGLGVFDEAYSLLRELGNKGDFSKAEIKNLLDRPIRVCGMVKNEGEPGGGPFWVDGEKGQSLQVVESAQINKEDKSQRSIFKTGTHFNPVDLVCGVRNYRGEKFNLLSFRDEEAGFISEKSHSGEKLLAMELPGLWNGGMANWNTVFVEVPLITFNPVKTVTDLLKPTHR